MSQLLCIPFITIQEQINSNQSNIQLEINTQSISLFTKKKYHKVGLIFITGESDQQITKFSLQLLGKSQEFTQINQQIQENLDKNQKGLYIWNQTLKNNMEKEIFIVQTIGINSSQQRLSHTLKLLQEQQHKQVELLYFLIYGIIAASQIIYINSMNSDYQTFGLLEKCYEQIDKFIIRQKNGSNYLNFYKGQKFTIFKHQNSSLDQNSVEEKFKQYFNEIQLLDKSQINIINNENFDQILKLQEKNFGDHIVMRKDMLQNISIGFISHINENQNKNNANLLNIFEFLNNIFTVSARGYMNQLVQKFKIQLYLKLKKQQFPIEDEQINLTQQLFEKEINEDFDEIIDLVDKDTYKTMKKEFQALIQNEFNELNALNDNQQQFFCQKILQKIYDENTFVMDNQFVDQLYIQSKCKELQDQIEVYLNEAIGSYKFECLAQTFPTHIIQEVNKWLDVIDQQQSKEKLQIQAKVLEKDYIIENLTTNLQIVEKQNEQNKDIIAKQTSQIKELTQEIQSQKKIHAKDQEYLKKDLANLEKKIDRAKVKKNEQKQQIKKLQEEKQLIQIQLHSKDKEINELKYKINKNDIYSEYISLQKKHKDAEGGVIQESVKEFKELLESYQNLLKQNNQADNTSQNGIFMNIDRKSIQKEADLDKEIMEIRLSKQQELQKNQEELQKLRSSYNENLEQEKKLAQYEIESLKKTIIQLENQLQEAEDHLIQANKKIQENINYQQELQEQKKIHQSHSYDLATAFEVMEDHKKQIESERDQKEQLELQVYKIRGELAELTSTVVRYDLILEEAIKYSQGKQNSLLSQLLTMGEQQQKKVKKILRDSGLKL